MKSDVIADADQLPEQRVPRDDRRTLRENDDRPVPRTRPWEGTKVGAGCPLRGQLTLHWRKPANLGQGGQPCSRPEETIVPPALWGASAPQRGSVGPRPRAKNAARTRAPLATTGTAPSAFRPGSPRHAGRRGRLTPVASEQPMKSMTEVEPASRCAPRRESLSVVRWVAGRSLAATVPGPAPGAAIVLNAATSRGTGTRDGAQQGADESRRTSPRPAWTRSSGISPAGELICTPGCGLLPQCAT